MRGCGSVVLVFVVATTCAVFRSRHLASGIGLR
jgi:hypothetical protein